MPLEDEALPPGVPPLAVLPLGEVLVVEEGLLLAEPLAGAALLPEALLPGARLVAAVVDAG